MTAIFTSSVATPPSLLSYGISRKSIHGKINFSWRELDGHFVSVCVCVYDPNISVCLKFYASVCVCVCVLEREREREHLLKRELKLPKIQVYWHDRNVCVKMCKMFVWFYLWLEPALRWKE